MIGIKVSGNSPFSKTEAYLKKLKKSDAKIKKVLDKYGKIGVEKLSIKTPVRTGLTAASWYYKVESENGVYKLIFCNSNVQNGIPIAIILDTGHATKNGGWVAGRNYINPALAPVFDKLASDMRMEVTKL